MIRGEQEKAEGRKTLGVWQNEENTAMVAAVWCDQIPSLEELLDLNPKISTDPSSFQAIEFVQKPTFGLMVQLTHKKYFIYSDMR